MAFYERRLPHWDTTERPLFVTFRLHGSLPASRIFPPANQTAGEAFAAMDRLLDEARSGPMYLREPAIAQLVAQALRDGQDRFHRYDLHAYVVMPNHVHTLVSPEVNTREWLMPLKGFTGHEANRLLHLSGPFWQDESYDHLVRDSAGFERITRYIENNPVKAGLVASPEDYPWSRAFAPGGSPAAAWKGRPTND